MTLDSLKDLVRRIYTEFRQYNSVYEFDGDLFGTFIEGHDKCRPVACEIHGEKEIARVDGLNVIRQIEQGIDDNQLAHKYANALDSEGTDREYATPIQRSFAAMKILLPEEIVPEGDET